MAKIVFDGNSSGKMCFSLISNNAVSVLDEAELGKEVKIVVRDEHGSDVEIAFLVTRNVHLGERQHWLYGSVLSTDGIYRQIEIKRYRDNPDRNSVEVFPQAPPIHLQKLR